MSFAEKKSSGKGGGAAALSGKSLPKKHGFFSEIHKNFPLYLMMVPGVLFLIAFSYLPMFGIIIAFKKVNYAAGILGSPWVGLNNFNFMFTSPDAWVITRNTIGYNLVFIFGGLIINVAMAIALNELRSKMFSKVCQTILLMPNFLSFVIVSYLALAFLQIDNGILNRVLLPALGKEPIDWYATSGAWPYLLIFIHFWKTMGYNCIVYLASIAGIDTQLYEAAEIDGATRWQRIRYITIPSLIPLMTILTIMNVGKIFNSDFGLFYQVPLNQGALYSTTNVISTYVYNMMTSAGTSGMGMASAAAFYQSVVGFILVVTTNAIVKKIDPENSLF